MQTYGSFGVRMTGRADLLDWVPILAPRLGLAGHEERKVRLIVGVDAGHDLDVGAVAFGQAAIPSIAKLVVAPGPLFLARSNVVVGDMHHTSLCGMIITPEEVLLRTHAHVRGRHGNIGVKGEVVGRVGDWG